MCPTPCTGVSGSRASSSEPFLLCLVVPRRIESPAPSWQLQELCENKGRRLARVWWHWRGDHRLSVPEGGGRHRALPSGAPWDSQTVAVTQPARTHPEDLGFSALAVGTRKRISTSIPTWLAVLVGWVLGGAISAALDGFSEAWLVAWLVVLACWVPMLHRLQEVPRRDAAIYGGLLWATIIALVFVRPLEEWPIRLVLEIALTVPAAYWLLDQPRAAHDRHCPDGDGGPVNGRDVQAPSEGC